MDPEKRFRALWGQHAPAVLAYALRRVKVAEDAADVVADTFTVGWRRIGEVPPGDEARLWLYGVARNVLANHRRAGDRRDRLGERLRGALAEQFADHADEVVRAVVVREAIARLPELDREVLTLAVWEELAPRDIATVLGLPNEVVRTRLSRARTRLRNEMGSTGNEQGVTTGKETR